MKLYKQGRHSSCFDVIQFWRKKQPLSYCGLKNEMSHNMGVYEKGLLREVVIVCPTHRKKNKSCVTQANTGYLEKAKFILCQIDPWIN